MHRVGGPMKWDNDYSRQPGPWGGEELQGGGPELEREIEEHAAHYAELHPDPPTQTGLGGIARRIASLLRGTRGSGRSPREAATPSEDTWVREEARYRAKNEGETGG